MDYLMLVNRDNVLDPYYVPYNLVKIDTLYKDNVYLEEEAYKNFIKLKEVAKEVGIYIDVMSGYRDYKYQEKLFNDLVLEKGYNYAYKYIAKPGSSEHQTGLAIDVVIYKDGKCYIEHEIEKLEEEVKWLHENMHNFGFILRYPKDKEEITKYSYEPWHIRYVGSISSYIYRYKLSLEEYLLRRG